MATRAELTAQRRSRWLHHFEQRQVNGLSVTAYIALHGLSQASWYAARKRYADMPTAPVPFVRVVTTPPVEASCMALRIHLRTGAVVEVDTPLSALPQVLAAVSATC
jgi:hypothetical protein